MTVNTRDARTHLSRLLDRVVTGEDIVISRYGRPVARLVPVKQHPAPRRLGWLKGKIWIAGNFDDPLPTKVLKSFYGRR